VRYLPTVALVTALGFGVPGPAYSTHKVYSPIVEKGELELEFRGHRASAPKPAADAEEKSILEIGYGVTDQWFTSLFIELEKEDGKREHEATAWENIFQLTEQGKYWLDAGVYLEYEWATESDHADKAEAKILLEKSVDRFVNTMNVIFEREVGSHRSGDTEFGIAWRTKYGYRKYLEPALEIYWEPGDVGDFNRFNDQDLRLGPILTGEWRVGKGEIRYEIGWLTGATDSTPNSTYKWMLEYELPLGH